jgi:DNA-binding response OmpR family regulator
MMPKMNGFDVCKNIRKSKPDLPVLLLTAKGTMADKTEGFDMGADDYIVKPFDIQEVLLRVRALLRRNPSSPQGPLSQEILKVGDIELFPDSLEAQVNDNRIKLTPTEFEILYCLMQHFNNSVTLAVLLNEVWGYDSDEDVRMLRVHVGGLRQKIEEDPKHPFIFITVTNVGYKLTAF